MLLFLESRSSCDSKGGFAAGDASPLLYSSAYSNAVSPGRMPTLHDHHLSRTAAR